MPHASDHLFSPSSPRGGDASEALERTLCDERVQLLPDRALYWPRERALFVADIHLGKSAAFRAGGVPVPHGTTAGDLDRLSRLIERTAAAQVFVLGDFLHAAAGRVPALDIAFTTWRETHRGLSFTLVRGNHDRHAGDPPAPWNMQVVAEPHAIAPFLLSHLPIEPPTGYALCGHVHPGALVAGSGFEWARLPCFVLGPRHAILPAFGRFTGLAIVPRRPDEEIVVIARSRVFSLP